MAMNCDGAMPPLVVPRAPVFSTQGPESPRHRLRLIGSGSPRRSRPDVHGLRRVSWTGWERLYVLRSGFSSSKEVSVSIPGLFGQSHIADRADRGYFFGALWVLDIALNITLHALALLQGTQECRRIAWRPDRLLNMRHNIGSHGL